MVKGNGGVADLGERVSGKEALVVVEGGEVVAEM